MRQGKYLYRYSSFEYNKSLFEAGTLRIGTLYDFRKSEHKRGIADPTEGNKSVTHIVDHWRMGSDKDSLHARANDAFRAVKITGEGPSRALMIGCKMIKHFEHPDCFIHCTSYELSRDVMEQFEGADSCVEIFDCTNFYRIITEKLSVIVPVALKTVAYITYKPRNEIYNGNDWGIQPTLLKEDEYSAQCEVRAIWLPQYRVDLEPQIITDERITKYCRLIENI